MAGDRGRLRRLSRRVRKDMSPQGQGFSGWSVKAFGPEAGYVARNAYMVSLPKSEVEEPVSNQPSTKELRDYQEKHREALSKPRTYHGGWLPGEGKQGVQDVSIRYGKEDPESLKSAAMDAVMHEQEGIGIVNKAGRYGGTINLPKHLSESQFHGGYPIRTQVTEKDGVVNIVPSSGEMLDLAANWIVENTDRLMQPESVDPRWHPEDKA